MTGTELRGEEYKFEYDLNLISNLIWNMNESQRMVSNQFRGQKKMQR